jgi:enamine deaminase RidA (YjgF/YER057c/UK114 family)
MSIERVNPPSLAVPSGFAHAVVAPASGKLVFLAGQTALDASGAIVGETLAEQFERALANLLAALAEAGGQPGDLASLTVYTVDLAAYREQGGHRRFPAVGRGGAGRSSGSRRHPGALTGLRRAGR